MKKFQILFDMRYANGSVIVEAATAEEAELKFDSLLLDELRDACDDVHIEIEQIGEYKE